MLQLSENLAVQTLCAHHGHHERLFPVLRDRKLFKDFATAARQALNRNRVFVANEQASAVVSCAFATIIFVKGVVGL